MENKQWEIENPEIVEVCKANLAKHDYKLLLESISTARQEERKEMNAVKKNKRSKYIMKLLTKYGGNAYTVEINDKDS